jgi:hypothetical protein
MSEPAPQQPAPTQPEPTPAAEPAPERTFTQAELDRIVQDRLARAKMTPPADYEELKAAKARLDGIEEQNKTELEKAQTRAEKAEQRATQIETEAKETRLRAAIIAEAAKPDRKVLDPEAVVALLDRTTLELDDQGVPTNIAKAMDSLLEAKDYLVATSGGARGNADQGARGQAAPGQLSREDLQRLSAEGKTAEIVKAQAEGRFDQVLGKS